MIGLLCLVLVFVVGSQGLLWDCWCEIVFEQFIVVGGLFYVIIISFVQVDDGVLWIGIFGGLVCYDGYCIQVFCQVDDDCGLLDNYVCVLVVILDGGVLVVIISDGLVYFDLVSN